MEEEEYRNVFLGGGPTQISVGDKVKCIHGDLTGICGTVESIDEQFVVFIPNLENCKEAIQYEKRYVIKYFELGDVVKVIDGMYKDETGIVTKMKDYYAFV